MWHTELEDIVNKSLLLRGRLSFGKVECRDRGHFGSVENDGSGEVGASGVDDPVRRVQSSSSRCKYRHRSRGCLVRSRERYLYMLLLVLGWTG